MKKIFTSSFLLAVLIGIILNLTGIFFPKLVQEQVFKIAILLYFMCPTGFPVPLQVQPLVKNKEDESFMSAFISLFLVIALITYILLTLFMSI